MKQKSISSEPATKDDVQNELKKLEARMNKRFATKDDLAALETRMDIKAERSELRTDDKARGYRDEVLTKLDSIMAELVKMREENAVNVYHTRELRVEVNDHEKRLTKLEHH